MQSNGEFAINFTRRDLLKLAAVAGTTLVLGACGPHGKAPSPPVSPQISETSPKEAQFSRTPTWEQDFAKLPDGELSAQYWNIDTGNEIPSYNQEAETLTDRPENVRIQNGQLIIEARKEPLNGKNYTSGRVNTQGKFSFQYGKLEVDLKAPQGVGVWPAAWLLPESPTATWPSDGEIDFFEYVGSEPGALYPDIHTDDTEASKTDNKQPLFVPNMTTAFNTYGVELTPGKIAFTHNDRVYKSLTQTSEDHQAWPFDQPYYLILNLAMGGSWGGESRDQYSPDGIAGNGPWRLAVQDVRYYPLLNK